MNRFVARIAQRTTRPSPEAEALLRESAVAWLSTTSADGMPAVVPVWFLWDGESFLVFSKPHARKVRNIAQNPRVMLALGEPEDDFDVDMLTKIAHSLLDDGTDKDANRAERRSRRKR